MSSRSLLAALALATPLVAACGGSPPIPGPGPTPVPGAPQITCPASVERSGLTATDADVTYADPDTTDGAPPVSVACTPASGSRFPLGQTIVTCTATDAQARQATCAFAVTLQHRPFALTRYLAFGDSMTLGENGRPIGGYIPFVDDANAYPTFLRQFFAERVPLQQVTVVNAGVGGEKVSESEDRLKSEIARNRPQVLLLLQGINDLNGGASPQSVVDALSDHIAKAKERGVQYVLVSTLLPVAPDNCGTPPPRCRGRDTTNAIVAATNQGLRSMVPASGAFVVDPYDEFLANRAAYVDIDGLHLRPAGNRALATAFWNRLVQVIPAEQLLGSALRRD